MFRFIRVFFAATITYNTELRVAYGLLGSSFASVNRCLPIDIIYSTFKMVWQAASQTKPTPGI